jgi:hypothetical protein
MDQWALEEVTPAIRNVDGVRSVKFHSGAGALRADISIWLEMDDASAYEWLLLDPTVRTMLGRLYGSWISRPPASRSGGKRPRS